jgi:hypothetical protein
VILSKTISSIRFAMWLDVRDVDIYQQASIVADSRNDTEVVFGCLVTPSLCKAKIFHKARIK